MIPVSNDYSQIIKYGLPVANTAKKRIIIAGAGVAGLAAGFELKKAGHDVTIIEARNRSGGRILTLREPFSAGLFGEAGAMRIPRAHELTLGYMNQFQIKAENFTHYNPNAYLYLGGQKYSLQSQIENANPGNFDISEEEKQTTAAEMWEKAIRHLVEKISIQGDEGWEWVKSEYDQYSVREFLEVNHWTEGAIERFGLLYNYEALMNSSFLELFREEAGNYYSNLVYLPNGSDQFLEPFIAELSSNIYYGSRIVAIDQTVDQVIFHCRSTAGLRSFKGDYSILTIPFPVMRHIEVIKPFSRRKQRAIRQLHYDSSAKIFLQARRRFWEEDEGIYGGGTITDLAIRNLFYPDHGRETGRGVLLASYTWGEDAQRWGSLSEEERVRQAIEDVSAIHPQIKEEFEAGASKVWHDDEYAGGAFALFDPGQQTLLYEDIKSPEGRIHFAGEHTSLFHAWIQGAIESGLRAAVEIHLR